MSDDSSLLWILIFIGLSAFFSSSETALFSLNKLQQKKIGNSGKAADKRILKLLSKPKLLLITILLGNTLVNISISSFATVYALSLNKHLGLALSNSTIITLQIVVTTIVILLVGEIIPKLVAWSKSYSIAKIYAFPLQLIMIIFWPVLKLLEFLSLLMSRRQGKNLEEDLTTEEFQTLIHSRDTMHTLEEHEKKILAGLFRFPKAEIREIMIPRVQIVAIEESQSMNDLKNTIIESGYSRVPVFRNTIDDIVGVAYAKDILLHPEIGRIVSIMRPAWFVTENMKVQSLLNQFKSKKTQIAVVVDEYGGTSGLITLEDILEELVGEIQDEYDEDEAPTLEHVDNHTYVVNGMYSIRELNNLMSVEINPDDFNNIADFLLEHFNHVPKHGERYIFDNLIEFTILDSTTRRINKVRMTRLDLEQHPEAEK